MPGFIITLIICMVLGVPYMPSVWWMDGRMNGEMVNGYIDGIDRRWMDDGWLEGWRNGSLAKWWMVNGWIDGGCLGGKCMERLMYVNLKPFSLVGGLLLKHPSTRLHWKHVSSDPQEEQCGPLRKSRMSIIFSPVPEFQSVSFIPWHCMTPQGSFGLTVFPNFCRKWGTWGKPHRGDLWE